MSTHSFFLFNKTPPHTISQLLYAMRKTAGDHAKYAKKWVMLQSPSSNAIC